MASKLDGTVTIPRRLAYRIWGLLAQECSPCAMEECQITRNPAEAVDQCAEQLSAALDGAAWKPPPGYAIAPKELWLQLHGDCHESELEEPVDYEGSDDVTWCWHRIHNTDVRYVRADVAGVPVAENGSRRDVTRNGEA